MPSYPLHNYEIRAVAYGFGNIPVERVGIPVETIVAMAYARFAEAQVDVAVGQGGHGGKHGRLGRAAVPPRPPHDLRCTRRAACADDRTLDELEGEGRVETSGGWMGYRTGETWLIPPATNLYRLVPGDKTRLLKAYVPDLEKDFRRPLLKRGKNSKQVARVVCA